MALINCSECGKEISDKAAACPHCGCPVAIINTDKTQTVKKKQTKTVKKPKTAKILLGIVCAIVVIFAIFFIRSNFSRYDWNDIQLNYLLPEPESKWGKLSSNRDDYLSLTVHRFSAEAYFEYITACVEMGFTVDAEQSDRSYSAYNEVGYELVLHYTESDDKMRINIDAPMEMGMIEWSDSEIAKLLPIPTSTEGKIKRDDEQGFEVYLKNISKSDLETYISNCEANGFTHNYEKEDNYYYAQNVDGYQFTAKYEGCNVVFLSIIEPQKTIELQFVSINSKCDVEVRIDDSYECTVEHGESETRTVRLGLGKHTIRVENDDNDEIYDYYEINVTEDQYIKLEVKCTKENIQIGLYGEPSNNQEPSDNGNHTESQEETKVTTDQTVAPTADSFNNLGYAEAARLFENAYADFESLITDVDDAIVYYNNNDFVTIEDIREYEAIWQSVATKAYAIQTNLSMNNPPAEYTDVWNGFVSCMGRIGASLTKGTNLDPNEDGHYTGDEMSDLIREIGNEFVEEAYIAVELTNEIKAISETIDTSTTSSNNTTKYSCAECGKNAPRTYTNPFSGEVEHYCETHYQEIIDIMSMMEDDVGGSNQSKHTCEQCSREGTHKYNSFTGQTEYYCTEHYEELMDMLDALGIG